MHPGNLQAGTSTGMGEIFIGQSVKGAKRPVTRYRSIYHGSRL